MLLFQIKIKSYNHGYNNICLTLSSGLLKMEIFFFICYIKYHKLRDNSSELPLPSNTHKFHVIKQIFLRVLYFQFFLAIHLVIFTTLSSAIKIGQNKTKYFDWIHSMCPRMCAIITVYHFYYNNQLYDLVCVIHWNAMFVHEVSLGKHIL